MNLNSQAQHFGYKGSEEAMRKPQADEGGATALLVRHLPEAIPHETLSRLFSHYGASSVRPCAGGRLRNCAFVDFKDETLASQAESQLNRLRFLGKVLSVERASKQILNNKNQKNEVQPGKDLNSLPTSWQKDLSKSLDGGANADSSSISEPIAKRLGVDYPFPPHLEYAYPPPDGNILTNIVNALIAVPRFYTQVLHLMNKMNIPAPFRVALTTPPLPPSVAAAPPPPPPPPPQPSPPIVAMRHVADLSSDESELESSEEGGDDINSFSVKDSRILKHGRKRARREVILGPAIDKEVAHEAVGLKPSTLVPKEIPTIKKNSSILKIRIAPKLAHEPKHDDENKEPIEQAKEDSEHKPYALPEEIESGKLPPEEILSLPMFKNYSAGNPACVLYIKNLAKDLVPEDFYFIFGSLFGGVEAAKSALSVKLMQEGRMRGQAFVTFPTVDLAHHALILVNGYVFKGKPMIIQFGRNAGAGKAN